ncbi:hypothetical protein DFQ27_005010 [Actinomortierella ambigua]|uniref:Uncharacterized protein n=1 Tax=Actinomortierella ambigua TaxID=1343610 RepID=A0A9P6U364_9FUNG|nr:hypothetical protein DFQ26_000485 [Actinomortierella ambigua]KAG0257649.1 hypothetical protein DFQ27_005010 [Actinomortierella ambigua]
MPTTASVNTSSAKQRRFSLMRMFNGDETKPQKAVEPDTPATPAPSIPAHYRHSMVPNMDNIHSDMLRERRKSLAALTENYRSLSLDLPSSNENQAANGPRSISGKTPLEMAEKMRQFDELLQKRRGSTIRISLTPTLLSEAV